MSQCMSKQCMCPTNSLLDKIQPVISLLHGHLKCQTLVIPWLAKSCITNFGWLKPKQNNGIFTTVFNWWLGFRSHPPYHPRFFRGKIGAMRLHELPKVRLQPFPGFIFLIFWGVQPIWKLPKMVPVVHDPKKGEATYLLPGNKKSLMTFCWKTLLCFILVLMWKA